MRYKEIIYACLDEIKANSDDSYVTEDYILFLVQKWRTALLVKTYKDIKKQIPESNYLTICLDLEYDMSSSNLCLTGFLKSKKEIPNTLPIGNTDVYSTDFYQGNIIFVSRERMKYVGNNKYMNNIIYASISPDNYLYLKSNNPQHKYLEKVKFTGIFEDSQKASELSCDDKEGLNCDILEKDFPLEDSLVTSLIELVVREILGVAYRPKSDSTNDGTDDLSDIINWARSNMKSGLQKLIE